MRAVERLVVQDDGLHTLKQKPPRLSDIRFIILVSESFRAEDQQKVEDLLDADQGCYGDSGQPEQPKGMLSPCRFSQFPRERVKNLSRNITAAAFWRTAGGQLCCGTRSGGWTAGAGWRWLEEEEEEHPPEQSLFTMVQP